MERRKIVISKKGEDGYKVISVRIKEHTLPRRTANQQFRAVYYLSHSNAVYSTGTTQPQGSGSVTDGGNMTSISVTQPTKRPPKITT